MTLLVKNGYKSQGTPLKIFTWHIHGSYLYYLSQSTNQFYIPVREDRSDGYGGRSGSFAWGNNVIEVPVEEIKDQDFDVILFQSRKNYLEDQYEILSERQRALPRVYLEHDPPREQPTDTKHIVDDPEMLLVHVTHFNKLMWDNNRTPSRVIDHGVIVPEDVQYSGELPRGLVVVNNLFKRGRRLGLDVFEYVRQRVPMDLIGINSDLAGGIGSLPLDQVAPFEARYRFFFNPIRYTSLGLAVCEAMMIGMPIIGLATTEMVTAVENDVSGYLDTNVDNLILVMKDLIENPGKASQWSRGAKEAAQKRFNIQRFAADWDETFRQVANNRQTEAVLSSFDHGENL